SVYNSIGTFTFDIGANATSNIYSPASFSNVPFTIRALTTALSYVPALPTPYGNNVTLRIFMNVSDPASLYDGQGLTVTNWTLSNSSGPWSSGVQYEISGIGGAYTVTIFSDVYSTIGSDTFDITASTINPIYDVASLTGVPFSVRALITAITYNPAITQPFGNNVSVEVFFNVSDPESVSNGLGLNVTWYLSNNTGSWSAGTQYLMSGSDGAYLFTILNSVYNRTGTFSFDLLGDPTELPYSNATFTDVPFYIRALTTAITWIPPDTQPWGNPVNVTIYYNVSDPVSVLYNGLGLDITNWTLSNSTDTWTSGIEYVVTGGSGVFLITIDNETVTTVVGSYTFNVYVDSGDSRYQSVSALGIPFTIRPLLTRLTYTPIPNVPWGNNITITFMYNVSDEASLWYNNLGISGATLSVTLPTGWNYGEHYTSWGNSGAYTLDISNITYSAIQNYMINVEAATSNPVYAPGIVEGFTYTIRALATVLTYDPVTPVPYGNPVNITYHLRINDPESDWYHGQDAPASVYDLNITNPSGWEEGINWTFAKATKTIAIFNNTAKNVGPYTFDLETVQVSDKYSKATFSGIPFSIRSLNTFLTYPAPAKNSWGSNATLTLQWQVIDTASLYHHGELIIGGQLEVVDPTNWTYWLNYTSSDLLNGNYILNISKDVVDDIKTYIIDLKVSHQSVDYYANTSYIGLPFSILQVQTSHTTIINSTYYLDGIGGWPWGDMVNVTVLYVDTDHGTLVPNSNISVQGDAGSPYESGNFTINGVESTVSGSATGIFVLILNGTAAENAIGYNFYITLYHPTGNYLNHTYLVTISFRKSVSQIIPKNPPVFVPWGDNITILFTYNNSEAGGFPGIPGANVDVNVSDPAAIGYFVYYENASMGSGAWIIKMNTTWANVTWNTQVEITFTMTAVAPGTMPAQSYHTVFITPLDSDLKTVIWDNSIFLEQANSFNVTVELRDRSHFNATENDFNLVVNNSYWYDTGSQGQYDNVQFIITTREGQFNNYTWYWGNISVATQSPGIYRLTFLFNQTPAYPIIQELLDYYVIIEVRGDRLDSSQTQVTVDLTIQTHDTAMTFNWTYANSTITPTFALAPFPTFTNGSNYFYGDLIDIYLFWYDLDSGAANPGISASFITTNWNNSLYYRVFNLYELNSQNDSYKGLFQIQVNTRLFIDMVGNYSLQINATLETFQRIYLLAHGYVSFGILPAPVNLTLREPILSIPYQDNAKINISVTNSNENNTGIFLSSDEIDISSIPGSMGGSKWVVGTNPFYGEYSLFFYTTNYDIGVYNATVLINKTNYEIITQNFTFEIREINTKIQLYATPQNISVAYTDNYTIKFQYIDNETYQYHIPIGPIPASPVDPNLNFNISNWYNNNGTTTILTDEVAQGIYKINIIASIDVGVYIVSIYVKLTHYELANLSLTINITKAATVIVPVEPDSLFSPFDVFQFTSKRFAVRYTTEFGEHIENGTLYISIIIGNETGPLIKTLSLVHEGNGIYSVDISGGSLDPGQTYSILVIADPNLQNYESTTLFYPNIFTVKPFWEHWLFIVMMVAIASVVGVVAYRRIKWYLTPDQVKEIIRATKIIKSGKEAKLPVVKSREEIFRMEFAEGWKLLEMEPPKLVRPEVVRFASEISMVLRTRMTTPEVETLINTLKTLSIAEAERFLSGMKVPPEATRRLLAIAGLIGKTRVDIFNFSQALSNIKGMEIPYGQVEEIVSTLKKMSYGEADRYLEAMVIPQEDRKSLLGLLSIKPLVMPKKIREEKIKEKEIERMSVPEIGTELEEISDLSEEEKKILIKDLKNLSLEQQKQILKRLKARIKKPEAKELLEEPIEKPIEEPIEKPIEEPTEVERMSISEIQAQLNKISKLSDNEKEFLLRGMEKLPLKNQKDILENLRKLKK
ncbi:MAG: hypothetical protein HWN66_10035, partial [Candidatus Helarchaeota archaeon]|nr:hypothetical protein [Candidatus Helarchaeota archaeon]